MSAGTAHRPEPAFLYRDTAEFERRLGAGAGGAQLAFVYRDTAEFERRFAGAGGAGAKAA
jgi:hypothetical protein